MLLMFTVFMLTGTLINGQRCQEDLIAQHLQLTSDQRPTLLASCERCMTERNVTQEELSAIERGQTADPSNDAMCYYGCYYLAASTMNKRNEIDYVELENYMSPETLRAVRKCEHVMDGKEHCRASYELYACFIKELKH